ncbi:MAG: hypothetical protein ABEJ72_05410 [Candidatus Aenigmatarchaeota archaeon]
MTATWTSTTSKKAALSLGILIFASLTAGQITGQGGYQDSGNLYSSDTGFSIPEYESQKELVTELVAPFVFLTVLLQFILAKVLHLVYADEDIPEGVPYGVPVRDEKPDMRKYSTLMAVTITAMLVPTPFWSYVRFVVGGIGLVTITAFAAALVYLVYVLLI